MVSAYLLNSSPYSVHAGDLNPYEQQVIAESRKIYEYEGKYYRAYENYVQLGINYLMEDQYDLTKEECSQIIAKAHASVAEGIYNGYLYEVSKEELLLEGYLDYDGTLTDKEEESTADSVITDSEHTNGEDTDSSDNQLNQDTNENGTSTDLESSNTDKRQDAQEKVIKNAGFSLTGTILIGGILMSVLTINLMVAQKLGHRVKKNEQNG